MPESVFPGKAVGKDCIVEQIRTIDSRWPQLGHKGGVQVGRARCRSRRYPCSPGECGCPNCLPFARSSTRCSPPESLANSEYQTARKGGGRSRVLILISILISPEGVTRAAQGDGVGRQSRAYWREGRHGPKLAVFADLEIFFDLDLKIILSFDQEDWFSTLILIY
jgi:hypothetical protein